MGDKMIVRKMTIKDCDRVSEIEKDTFSMPWSRDNFEGSILQENYCLLVAVSEEDDSDILGYCCFYYVLDEAEIPNVCVRKDMRGQGIAFKMMTELIKRAKEFEVRDMYLEVRVSNEPARALYRKLGFRDVGIRKGFYDLPKEDAVIMRLNTE
ncbi:MAG: ribosomal protein S18-alanine N-acetyltransferase [Lachnospiraceae bacterium]|nr:ribosomal protein S18-alanine N-acetyltransferase [Lachnospiraceae bacterium]